MNIVAVADTHTALWYLYDDPRLSESARTFITLAASQGHKIAVSSVSLAEVVYLEEKGRIRQGVYDALTQALADPENVFTEVVFDSAVVTSMRLVSRDEVPDMPDRMIAATAVRLGVPCVSRDRRIRSASLVTLW